MTKKQVNCIKRVIAGTRNAIRNLGWYMPSDPQTAALKSLLSAALGRIGARDAIQFQTYLETIDCANRAMVYTVCADEKQLAAVEKALAVCENA